MPGPFPGMDPYLEHPLLWPMLQQHLVGAIADALAVVLPRRYQAEIRERIFLDEPDRTMFPARSPNCLLPAWQKPHGNGQNAADPCWHIALAPEEVRECYLVITSVEKPQEVLTAVEVLTLGNKTPGSAHRQHYQTQQRAMLVGAAHLLELDLLRTGLPTVAAPQQRLLRRGSFDYLACLSRGERRDFCEVWAVPLERRLPRVALPLGGDDLDLTLDLQTLLATAYEAGSLSRWLDYNAEPYFPLTRAQQSWVEEVLLTQE